MKKFATVSFVLVSLVLIASLSPALAGGATVIHDNWNSGKVCYTWNTIETCWQQKGTWHYVDTPSGNRIYKFKGTWEYSYTNTASGGVFYEYSDDYKYHYLIKSSDMGGTHVFKQSYESNNAYDNGICYTNSWEWEYQYVNGQIIRNDSSYEFDYCN